MGAYISDPKGKNPTSSAMKNGQKLSSMEFVLAKFFKLPQKRLPWILFSFDTLMYEHIVNYHANYEGWTPINKKCMAKKLFKS